MSLLGMFGEHDRDPLAVKMAKDLGYESAELRKVKPKEAAKVNCGEPWGLGTITLVDRELCVICVGYNRR